MSEQRTSDVPNNSDGLRTGDAQPIPLREAWTRLMTEIATRIPNHLKSTQFYEAINDVEGVVREAEQRSEAASTNVDMHVPPGSSHVDMTHVEGRRTAEATHVCGDGYLCQTGQCSNAYEPRRPEAWVMPEGVSASIVLVKGGGGGGAGAAEAPHVCPNPGSFSADRDEVWTCGCGQEWVWDQNWRRRERGQSNERAEVSNRGELRHGAGGEAGLPPEAGEREGAAGAGRPEVRRADVRGAGRLEGEGDAEQEAGGQELPAGHRDRRGAPGVSPNASDPDRDLALAWGVKNEVRALPNWSGRLAGLLATVRRETIEACAVVAEIPVLRDEPHRIVRNIRNLAGMSAETVAKVAIDPASPTPSATAFTYACVNCTRPLPSHGMCPTCSSAYGHGREDAFNDSAEIAEACSATGPATREVIAERIRGRKFATVGGTAPSSRVEPDPVGTSLFTYAEMVKFGETVRRETIQKCIKALQDDDEVSSVVTLGELLETPKGGADGR